jgi:hypothetical protein
LGHNQETTAKNTWAEEGTEIEIKGMETNSMKQQQKISQIMEQM